MKSIRFLPPVLALAICSIWIGCQRREISSLERKCALLRKETSARQTNDAASQRTASHALAPKVAGPLDWRKIAKQLEAADKCDGIMQIREFERIKTLLRAMDKESLADALLEFASLDMPNDARQSLGDMMVEILVEKDASFALEQCASVMSDTGGLGCWQFVKGFGEWVKKDHASAVAWFDRQIAAGVLDSKSLDGRSLLRMNFERMLISNILASDPEDAARRIAAFPENQRAEVLGGPNLTRLVKPETAMAYAKLVRQSLAADESLKTIALFLTGSIYSPDAYSLATEAMDRIEATPAERGAGVEAIAKSRFVFLAEIRKITKGDIDEFRAWAGTQAPNHLDQATGKALAECSRYHTSYSDAAGLALQYHAISGADELLLPLLEHHNARWNKEQARELAGKISDQTLREKYLTQFK